ncbi:MAG: hypothetical protein C0501_21260 [Isosphaera sp.]|nr:hypothetical protein [Isosphaera sp.]
MKPMTPKEVAERANVSLSLVYALLHSGKLKGMRIGCRGRGKWLVDPADYDAFIATCKLGDLPEPDTQPFHFLK